MSRLLCCLRARRDDMGAALSHAQEGEACEGAGPPEAPPTMADVIRERKKKAGGAGLGTLRRRLAAAARRPRPHRPDRGCEHARFIRSVVSSWRLAEVFLLCSELEAGAALRDLTTQAELAREPAAALHQDLHRALTERWWCDVELAGAGWSVCAHRAVLAARCTYFRDLLQRYPPGARRVCLDGACAGLSRGALAGVVCALYAPNAHPASPDTAAAPLHKWEHSGSAEGDLDIISGDNDYAYRTTSLCRCDPRSRSRSRSRADGAQAQRLASILGFSPDALHQDMRYLLESGEMSDCRLSWGAYELPAHRLVLAARSRYFRSVMSRRGAGGAAGSSQVCVDEKVLPHRFAAALLHAAYTDQVDLSLIGRNTSSPASTTSGGSSGTTWTGGGGGGGGGRGRAAGTAALDDAFQLYEIARFLEMPIVVQGCEDAIVEALSADTLPHVLRWACAPHASRWVHRQAMRYLRDEFPAVMAAASAARLPRPALADALASPFLQASEAQALRALLRWAAAAAPQPPPKQPRPPAEPNVVWHTAHSVSRRGGRRREVSDAALREVLAALVPHVRLEHLPPDHELLQQMVRRGLISAPVVDPSASAADAWLGRGANRPARCFLPHLDELKALLECQAPPEAELARMRRARYMHRIPDTLYMVAAARGGAAGRSPGAAGGTGAGGGVTCEGACVSPRVLGGLRARMRELSACAPAARALQLHAHDTGTVRAQIALRTVREMSLPDSCADLLLNDDNNEREREWESPGSRRRWEPAATPPDCCRRARPRQTDQPATHDQDNSRASTCRREPSRGADAAQHRQSVSICGSVGSGTTGSLGAGGRLSACVPDVAMAPNANTHLLTAPAYAHPTHLTEYGTGGILQLDLGDGATHTPRPGSRAARAMAAQAAAGGGAPGGGGAGGGGAAAAGLARHAGAALACARARPDDDELRAAIELSVIRAYSSFHPRAHSPSLLPALHARCRASNTLPHPYRDVTPNAPPAPQQPLHRTSRASPSPSSLSASNSGHLAHHHRPMSRVGSGGVGGAGVGGAGVGSAGVAAGGAYSSNSSSASASPSPRRHKLLQPPRDYRLDAAYGSPGPGSRGQSPSNYA